MTQTLDERIRHLGAAGQIRRLMLHQSPTTGNWLATFTPTAVFGITYAEDADPIKALMKAMRHVEAPEKPHPGPPSIELKANPPTAEDLQRGIEDLM